MVIVDEDRTWNKETNMLKSNEIHMDKKEVTSNTEYYYETILDKCNNSYNTHIKNHMKSQNNKRNAQLVVLSLI